MRVHNNNKNNQASIGKMKPWSKLLPDFTLHFSWTNTQCASKFEKCCVGERLSKPGEGVKLRINLDSLHGPRGRSLTPPPFECH